MTTYAVLLPGDESYWDTASAEERQAGYARHEAFARVAATTPVWTDRSMGGADRSLTGA